MTRIHNSRLEKTIRTPGNLVTLTGPSGCGKTTVAQLLTTLRGDFCEACSHTTRAPRDGEVEGTAYYFVNHRQFAELHHSGGFLESIEYNETYYGISKREISDNISTGMHTILVVEPVGAEQIRARYDGGTLVQIYIEADEECVRGYMLARGDAPEAVEKRIQNDRAAIRQGRSTYDVKITNNSSIAALCKAVMDAVHKA